MQENVKQVMCLIKNGKSGTLRVNGKNYNQAMPGISTLTDLEVAQITTFVYNSWTHDDGLFEVSRVSKILSACDSLERDR
jgi:hypothetical protein